MLSTEYKEVDHEWAEIADLSINSPITFLQDLRSGTEVDLHFSDSKPAESIPSFPVLTKDRTAFSIGSGSGKVFSRCSSGKAIIQMIKG